MIAVKQVRRKHEEVKNSGLLPKIYKQKIPH